MLNIFKQKPFPMSFLALGILIVLHVAGSYYSLYWAISWFDLLVHLVSGLWVALVILWLTSVLGQVNSLKEYKIKIFLIALLSALILGVVWEILENITQITFTDSSGYALNTALDLVFDGLGGILAYGYFIKRKKCIDNSVDVLHPFYNKIGITTK